MKRYSLIILVIASICLGLVFGENVRVINAWPQRALSIYEHINFEVFTGHFEYYERGQGPIDITIGGCVTTIKGYVLKPTTKTSECPCANDPILRFDITDRKGSYINGVTSITTIKVDKERIIYEGTDEEDNFAKTFYCKPKYELLENNMFTIFVEISTNAPLGFELRSSIQVYDPPKPIEEPILYNRLKMTLIIAFPIGMTIAFMVWSYGGFELWLSIREEKAAAKQVKLDKVVSVNDENKPPSKEPPSKEPSKKGKDRTETKDSENDRAKKKKKNVSRSKNDSRIEDSVAYFNPKSSAQLVSQFSRAQSKASKPTAPKEEPIRGQNEAVKPNESQDGPIGAQDKPSKPTIFQDELSRGQGQASNRKMSQKGSIRPQSKTVKPVADYSPGKPNK